MSTRNDVFSRTIGSLALATLLITVTGCHSTKVAETPAGPNFHLMTYNVNWGEPRPELAAALIRKSGADIVCLQETTPAWEQFLRQNLASDYSFVEFRHSTTRMGGGLAFLAKVPAREVAYIPSETGWFDGWIMRFETAAGPVQVLNVHLRPPISDRGSWISGYLSTGGDRLREMERFCARCESGVPTLVSGDFNDSPHSAVVEWLQQQKLINALPEFDRYSPTWHWSSGIISLHRRMDHILYSPELHCCAARVLPAGASDHFPVEAVFSREENKHEHPQKEKLAGKTGGQQRLSRSFPD